MGNRRSGAMERAYAAWLKRPPERSASAHAKMYGVSFNQFRKVRIAEGEAPLPRKAPYAERAALQAENDFLRTELDAARTKNHAKPQPSVLQLAIENAMANPHTLQQNSDPDLV